MISISRYLNMNGKNCLETILHRGNATYHRNSQGERMDLFWVFCIFYIWERICGLTEWRCNISLHHFRLLTKIISTALARYETAQPTVGDLEWAMGELRYGKYDIVLLENCETRTNCIPFENPFLLLMTQTLLQNYSEQSPAIYPQFWSDSILLMSVFACSSASFPWGAVGWGTD